MMYSVAATMYSRWIHLSRYMSHVKSCREVNFDLRNQSIRHLFEMIKSITEAFQRFSELFQFFLLKN